MDRVYVLALIFFLIPVFVDVSGQEQSLVVVLDVATTFQGTMITISGSGATPSQLVSILITSPTGAIVSVLSIFSTSVGDFSTVVVFSDDRPLGTYTIKVEDDIEKTQITFELTTTGIIILSSNTSTSSPPSLPSNPTPEPIPESSTIITESSELNDSDLLFKTIQLENEELKKANLDLKLEIRELKQTIDNLNQLVLEQLKVIYEWVLSR